MSISFVVPVLNAEQYIRQCLESIFAEKADSDEVIVIDNGSTDETVNIVETFENVILLIQPHITVAALRNKGVTLSSHELFAFIDADCVLCKGWRRQVIEVFTDKSVHAAGSRYDIPENAGWIEKAWYSQKNAEKRRVRYINSGNLVVRRVVFEDINGFDERLETDEDCDFGGRLHKAGYFMMEDPDIRVVHLGNPKSLKAFYQKEKWHATNALAAKFSELFDRPTIMSILFGITILVSVVCMAASVWIDINYLWAVSLVLLLPLTTAVYRAYQFKKYRYIPELTLLWGIFFMVRINNMVKHLFFKGVANV